MSACLISRFYLRPEIYCVFTLIIPRRFAGHSKWSKIKREKGENDVKRALTFSRTAREIIAAVKASGSDPLNNHHNLSVLLAKARSINMPKVNIEQAVKKGQGGTGIALQEYTYEGSALGVSFIVTALTDNSNRTAKDIKCVFSRCGGGLASVRHMFDKRGRIEFMCSPENTNQALSTVLAISNVHRVLSQHDSECQVLCEFEALNSVIQIMQRQVGIEVIASEPIWQCKEEYIVLIDQLETEQQEKINQLIERLESVEGVSRVSGSIAKAH